MIASCVPLEVPKPSIGVGPSVGQIWSKVVWFQPTITWPTCEFWPVSDAKRPMFPKMPSWVAAPAVGASASVASTTASVRIA